MNDPTHEHGASMFKVLVGKRLTNEEGEAFAEALNKLAEEHFGDNAMANGTGLQWTCEQDPQARLVVLTHFAMPLGGATAQPMNDGEEPQGTPIVEGLEAMLQAQNPPTPPEAPASDDRPMPGQYL